MPLLEDIHVAESDAGIEDLNVAEPYRGHGDDFTVLNVLRRSDDLVRLAPEHQAPPRKSVPQSEIRDGGLAARVDDRLGVHIADEHVDDHQSVYNRMKRHIHEAPPGLLVTRISYDDLIVMKVDENALARQSFGPEYALRPAERIRHDGQDGGIYGKIADGQGIDLNGRHRREARHPAQYHRRRHIRRNAERQRDESGDGAVTGAGVEHHPKRPVPVDHHRRPDPAYLIAPGGRDVSRLGRLHQDILELLDGRRGDTRRRSVGNRAPRRWRA